MKDPHVLQTATERLGFRVDLLEGAEANVLSEAISHVTHGVAYARKAAIGTLGRPRYSVIAEWHGGKVAREIKQLVPSAWVWARAEGIPDKGRVNPTTVVSSTQPCVPQVHSHTSRRTMHGWCGDWRPIAFAAN